MKQGYKVSVVTGIPNYPEGRFYRGYGYLKRRSEKWNGIMILRLPIIARGKSTLGMILNYFSFVVSGYFWKCFTKIKADYVFIFEVSPMTQALVGVWYAKKHKIPNYLYVQDLWPENVKMVTGIHSPMIIRPIEKMVDYIYKNCNEIFATSPGSAKAICSRGFAKEKVHYWPQYAEDFYRPLKYKSVPEIEEEEVYKIIFTGNIGYAQGLDILPKTAKLLKVDGCKVKFYIVGDGRYKEELCKEIKERNVEDMFVMIGRKPAERIPELLAVCDVAFLSFQKSAAFSMTIPAKLQSYMACGIPILAVADGEAKRIVEEADCGMVCRLGDAGELKDTIIALMKETRMDIYGRNARKYYRKNFDKKKLFEEIEKYF